jgi:hypothetical protein
MKKTFGARFMTTIKDLYSVAVDDGEDFLWQDVTDHVRKRLSSHDAVYLICATHCLRENASTLIQWLLFQKQVRKEYKEMKISYPNLLWVQLCIGQISPPERQEIKLTFPVTENKMQEFKLGFLEKEVLKMTKKLPAFSAKDVREYTRRLLVARVAMSKDIGESKTRYCKSCKMKHLTGKHTAEGKLRYKQFLANKKNSC